MAVRSILEVTGTGVHSKERGSTDLCPGNHKGTGVKYTSMNTVYGANTDLSFIENFIESTKIHSSEASNAAPLKHDFVL